jgi:hypothetical protein
LLNDTNRRSAFTRNYGIGKAAIERVREEDPAAYLRAIVSVLPKELKIDTGPLSDLADEELRALLYAARNAVAQADAAAE